MIHKPLFRALLAGSLALGAASPCAHAQTDPNGPTALIISYRAKPETRVKFRKFMATDGVAQLDRWKSQGVFSAYNALFTTFAGDSAPDMFLVLKFAHFTDLARWETIEQTNPGGLPEAAQALASVDYTATADILKEEVTAPPTAASQFFVLEYDVLTDAPKYASYVKGYVAPQFDGWIKSGILASYGSYVNQNPAGAPWSSFIVLEYKDMKGLAAREIVKTKVREQLAVADPVWKKWSDDKSAIRKEKAAIPAVSLK